MKKTIVVVASMVAITLGAFACDSSDTGGSGGSSSASSTGTGKDAGDLTPAESCVKAGEKGNSQGVGEYCTPGGGECAAFAKAGLCLADVGQDQWFCTRIGCKGDADCSEEAVCYKDPSGAACIPARCADSGAGGAGGAGGN